MKSLSDIFPKNISPPKKCIRNFGKGKPRGAIFFFEIRNFGKFCILKGKPRGENLYSERQAKGCKHLAIYFRIFFIESKPRVEIYTFGSVEKEN